MSINRALYQQGFSYSCSIVRLSERKIGTEPWVMRVMIMFCLMFFFKPVLPTYFHEVFPGACLGLQMDQPAEFFETISKRFGTSWPNNTPNLVSEVKVSRLAMFIGIIRVRFPSFPMRYLA